MSTTNRKHADRDRSIDAVIARAAPDTEGKYTIDEGAVTTITMWEATFRRIAVKAGKLDGALADIAELKNELAAARAALRIAAIDAAQSKA